MSSFVQLMKRRMNERTIQSEVLGFCGSPRKNGNSDILLQHILRGVRRENIAASHFFLRDLDFQGCIGCERCRKDHICTGLHDGMSTLYPEIAASKALVLVCPTHNYNVTSWMKAFIDRLYCFYIFDNNRPRGWASRIAGQGRKALVAAVYEQADERDMGFTLEGMRLPLEALGYEVIDDMAVSGIFDRGKVKHNNEVLARAEALGRSLARSIS